MISSNEMRVLEDYSESVGVSRAALMENAGKAAFNQIAKRFKLKGKNAVVVCGQGNNGGDGFVVARYLSKKCSTKVIFLGKRNKLKEEAKKAYSKLSKNILAGKKFGLMDSADLVIDAMLGTGVKGKIKEPYASAIKRFNSAKGKKISLDLPSGVDPDSGKGRLYVKPDLIITFHDVKPGIVRFGGKVKIVDIGIPKLKTEIVKEKDLQKCFPKRKSSSHKGENGKVLIVGGSNDLVGAPALAAMAALASLRTGVDLVVVTAPEKCGFVINSYSPDIIVKKFKGDFFTKKHSKKIIELSKNFDAVLIGPGLGRERQTLLFVKEIIEKIKIPMVLDADAIKAVKGIQFKGNVLLTPHATEFYIFSGKKLGGNREVLVKEVARKHNCTILLKGQVDVISDGIRIALNKTGNAAMTVGGTGDVLAGICTALISLGNGLFESASAAAYLNCRVGEQLFKEKGISLVASDFIGKIPTFIRTTAK